MTQPKQVTQSLNLLNAAPEMYAALVAIRNMEHGTDCVPWLSLIRYPNAKAECNCHRAVAAEALRKVKEAVANYA